MYLWVSNISQSTVACTVNKDTCEAIFTNVEEALGETNTDETYNFYNADRLINL